MNDADTPDDGTRKEEMIYGLTADERVALRTGLQALPATMPLWMVVLLPVIVAVGAVWGDLLESLIKREFGVKYAGAWLPGFGGLLDRADSLVVTIPLIYYIARPFL